MVTDVVVAMPAYNEAEGIGGFLRELHEALGHYQVSFVVVDDCSRDGTAAAVEECALAGLPVTVERSAINRGHGPTTIQALRVAVARAPDLVVAVDGDGQFMGDDVARLVSVGLSSGAPVVEGVRTGRGEPAFRRVASLATRVLVRSRCGLTPRDANTPLRVYRLGTLSSLLDQVPAGFLTPNLLISATCRQWGLAVAEVPVASLPRRGRESTGSTWGSGRRALPNRRFVVFCRDASVQWFRVSRRRRS